MNWLYKIFCSIMNCLLQLLVYSGQSTISSIKHHKLKRRMELKERNIWKILKNHIGQFHLRKLHTSYGGLIITYVQFTSILHSWKLLCCMVFMCRILKSSAIASSSFRHAKLFLRQELHSFTVVNTSALCAKRSR